jgi:hypothetical protein
LIIDASIRLQFPALSTQTHTPGSRCCAPRIPIGLWRSISLGAGRDGRLYTPEDSSVANLHGALDTLNGGITTLYGWSHNNNSAEHWDASVQGLKDGGMRGVFGYGNANAEWFPPSTLPTNCDDFRRVCKQHFDSDDQLLTAAMASRGSQFATIDIAEKDFLTAGDIDASKLFDASLYVARNGAADPDRWLNAGAYHARPVRAGAFFTDFAAYYLRHSKHGSGRDPVRKLDEAITTP